MGRLSVVDEIFLRSHRGLGTPIALQGLWRTADRVDPELLRRVHDALRVGPLGRRVVRARIPGARRMWQRNVRAHPLELIDDPIPAGALLHWADHQGFDLDPEYGPGWRLSAASVADGGSLITLTCSHALADGRALVIAVDAALRGASSAGSATKRIGSVPQSDWADARRQWAIVVRGTARALSNGIPQRPTRTFSRLDNAILDVSPVHGVVLRCPVPDWDQAAVDQGGTANSLFILLIANLLWESGFPHETIEASLPVDTRDEPRVDNNVAMTQISVVRTDTPASIREKSRTAYEYRMSSPSGMPEELLQVIPDQWAYALSKGAGERDILCSNIGTLPDSLLTLGPHHCTGVAARAIHPGLTTETRPRTRLSGYLCRIGDSYTVAVISIDPTHIGTTEALRGIVHNTTTDMLLPVTLW